jgi:hypothetical protein
VKSTHAYDMRRLRNDFFLMLPYYSNAAVAAATRSTLSPQRIVTLSPYIKHSRSVLTKLPERPLRYTKWRIL